MRCFLLLLFLAAFSFAALPVQAQDEDRGVDQAASDQEDPSESRTEEVPEPNLDIKDRQISVENLTLLLKPLTKEYLEELYLHWQQMLADNVRKLGETAIKRKLLEGDAKEELLEEEEKLIEIQDAIYERTSLVLDALKMKGGDVENARLYINTATGVEVETDDLEALWTKVTNWLISDKGGIKWGKNILLFFLTLIAFWILAVILSRGMSKAVAGLKRTSDLLKDFFVNSVRRITFFIGIVVALSMLEVDIGPFLAAIGVMGFVIGFALQGTLSNFASGIMILIYRPYDIGDVITAAGVTGKVDSMSLVSTTLKTFDNQDVVVPNSSIWGDIITNITANDTRRVDLVFGIGYDADMAKAQSILEDILKKHPKVLGDPEPVIKVHELADSSVNFIVRPWARTQDYWDVYWDVTRTVKERFDAEGISIPFPQRDVHVHGAALAPPATP